MYGAGFRPGVARERYQNPAHELLDRTKAFSLRIIGLTNALPDSKAGHAIGSQIIRSGTSVAANYRAACRAKSSKDFLNKVLIVEEADETLFWLEMISESALIRHERLSGLIREANELTAIFTSTGKTVRRKIASEKQMPA